MYFILISTSPVSPWVTGLSQSKILLQLFTIKLISFQLLQLQHAFHPPKREKRAWWRQYCSGRLSRRQKRIKTESKRTLLHIFWCPGFGIFVSETICSYLSTMKVCGHSFVALPGLNIQRCSLDNVLETLLERSARESLWHQTNCGWFPLHVRSANLNSMVQPVWCSCWVYFIYCVPLLMPLKSKSPLEYCYFWRKTLQRPCCVDSKCTWKCLRQTPTKSWSKVKGAVFFLVFNSCIVQIVRCAYTGGFTTCYTLILCS